MVSDDPEFDRRPIAERLTAAANGEDYQLRWLCEGVDEINRLGLALLMIAEAAPDDWSREVAADAISREFKPLPKKTRLTDIVTRLRNHSLPDPHDEREVLHDPLLREAAEEIERLRQWSKESNSGE